MATVPELAKELGSVASSIEKAGDSCGKSDIEWAKKLLRRLDQAEITPNLLATTGIGRTVNKLKHNHDVAIATLAKKLVKTWKKLVLNTANKEVNQDASKEQRGACETRKGERPTLSQSVGHGGKSSPALDTPRTRERSHKLEKIKEKLRARYDEEDERRQHSTLKVIDVPLPGKRKRSKPVTLRHSPNLNGRTQFTYPKQREPASLRLPAGQSSASPSRPIPSPSRFERSPYKRASPPNSGRKFQETKGSEPLRLKYASPSRRPQQPSGSGVDEQRRNTILSEEMDRELDRRHAERQRKLRAKLQKTERIKQQQASEKRQQAFKERGYTRISRPGGGAEIEKVKKQGADKADRTNECRSSFMPSSRGYTRIQRGEGGRSGGSDKSSSGAPNRNAAKNNGGEELRKWLADLLGDMSCYTSALIADGFTSLEIMKTVTEADLDRIKVKIPHRRIILKAAEVLKTKKQGGGSGLSSWLCQGGSRSFPQQTHSSERKIQRSHKSINDYYQDEDEFDSDDSFIVDDDEEDEFGGKMAEDYYRNNYREEIMKSLGRPGWRGGGGYYGRSYGGDEDSDLSDMEASYEQMQREEKFSALMGEKEDEEELERERRDLRRKRRKKD